MLKKIITEGDLGVVIGDAENGESCLLPILKMNPDVVLIDLLMPVMDGIETMEHLRIQGYEGQFIMISQIVNKTMVGEAYEKGVEFFIHKPINRVEVQSILKKVTDQFRLKHSLQSIRESLEKIGTVKTVQRQQSVKEIVLSILNDMGIIGEVGSDDIVSIMEHIMNQPNAETQIPPLKDLYESIAIKMGLDQVEAKKESKAIEQRIRRTILVAINNLATLGSIDYTNPEFEYYAPRYFDFQEIRNQMIHIRESSRERIKVKVNSKKFLQVLYLETIEKYNQQAEKK